MCLCIIYNYACIFIIMSHVPVYNYESCACVPFIMSRVLCNIFALIIIMSLLYLIMMQCNDIRIQAMIGLL